MNFLFYGDNLKILREKMADKTIDLIYLDPPFNSKANYNMLFKEVDGTSSDAQIHAFGDTWTWDHKSLETFEWLVQNGQGKLPELMDALQTFLGHNAMFAYLVMMAARLVEMQRVLKDTGSIYLHCDPTASHYIKLVMDAVFGVENFRNEIVWKRKTGKGETNSKSSRFGSSTDRLFFYSKTDSSFFETLLRESNPEYVKSFFKYTEPNGRIFATDNLASPSPRPNLMYEYKGYKPPEKGWAISKEKMEEWDKEGRLWFPQKKDGRIRRKRYLDELEGSPIQDLWDDVKPISSQAAERLGYPTQKPEALLERIIEASCPADGVVLDPFCGCGTTIAVAEKLKRKWIGIDVTYLAVVVMRRRLEDTFGDKLAPYQVIGNPTDLAGAKALAEESEHDGRYQFQWWAVDLVGGHPLGGEKKKGSDKGIDGIIRFFDDDSGKAKKIIISVKSGKVGSKDVRDLNGTIKREKAEIGCFITLQPPTQPMKDEAVEEGFYQAKAPDGVTWFDPVPKVQILSVDGLLNGTERLQYSRMHESTFQKAELHKEEVEDGGLF